MTKTWLLVVAGLTLAAPLAARAQQGASAPSKGAAKGDEPKKHIGELDVYLRDAINNTKVLYETTQLQPGKLDMTIAKEGIDNIDKALSGALMHVSHTKSLPEAKVVDVKAMDSIHGDLTSARAMLTPLRAAVRAENRDQLASLTTQLYGVLKSADDKLGVLAEKQNVTRVDKILVPEAKPSEQPSAQPPSEQMPREQPRP